MHKHTDWRSISKETWDKCWDFSQEIEDQKRNWKVSTYWVYQSHFYGLLGEALVSNMLGIPWNNKLLADGDGKTDFLGIIDVKTSAFCSDPHLKALESELKDDKIFMLVGLCLKDKCAKYFGYATSQMLREAPIVNYGKGQRYSLTGKDLLQGLPTLEVSV